MWVVTAGRLSTGCLGHQWRASCTDTDYTTQKAAAQAKVRRGPQWGVVLLQTATIVLAAHVLFWPTNRAQAARCPRRNKGFLLTLSASTAEGQLKRRKAADKGNEDEPARRSRGGHRAVLPHHSPSRPQQYGDTEYGHPEYTMVSPSPRQG